MSDQLLHHPEAESAVLGAILRNEKVPVEVEVLLNPDDFYDPHLGAVYAAAVRLAGAGKPCTYVAVAAELDAPTRRALDNGIKLIDLSTNAPVGGAEYHAEIVAKDSDRRKYIAYAAQVAHAAREGVEDLDALAHAALAKVPRTTKVDTPVMWDVLGELMDPQADSPGIPYGFPDLDEVLPTMKPGQMTTIAARSGVGKSTLGVDLLRHAAYRLGRKVLMISIEMPVRQVVSRILSAEAKIQHHIIEKNLPRDHSEEQREQEAAARIGNGPLVVVKMVQPTVADVRAVVRQEKPDLVLIDYLGRMQLPKADRHDLALTAVVDGLSNVAATEQCHVIILSQLNRKGDGRNDKRPVIGDLRDTAALEHYSDVVLLLHRPDLYEDGDRPGEVDIIVAKNREGKSGVAVPLAAQLHYSRFTSMAHGAQPTPSEPVVDITEPTRHGQYA